MGFQKVIQRFQTQKSQEISRELLKVPNYKIQAGEPDHGIYKKFTKIAGHKHRGMGFQQVIQTFQTPKSQERCRELLKVPICQIQAGEPDHF